MILSDVDILRAIQEGLLVIEPFDRTNLSACSYDLTLHPKILVPHGAHLIDVKDRDISKKKLFYEVEIPQDGLVLLPGRFYLASTNEFIKLSDKICAFLEGRSSIGRLGLFIHNAGWIDAGFYGQITLELFNASSNCIRIYPNMRICQIVFSYLNTPAQRVYQGKYNDQVGPTPSRIYLDKEFQNCTEDI